MTEMNLKEKDYDTSDPAYQEFTDKFKRKPKPKLTTDDCFTPPLVYDAICGWVCERYGIQKDQIVRPFFPGGDYEHAEYPEDCVVLDNPPFSKVANIIKFYSSNNIRFFLFVPGKNCLRYTRTASPGKLTVIVTDTTIRYENGAIVNTAFVTNLEHECSVIVNQELRQAIEDADISPGKVGGKKAQLKKWPDQILTFAMLANIASHGAGLKIPWSGVKFVEDVGGYRPYGGALLLSEWAAAERAAAERAAAERAAAVIVELTEKEREICMELTRNEVKDFITENFDKLTVPWCQTAIRLTETEQEVYRQVTEGNEK